MTKEKLKELVVEVENFPKQGVSFKDISKILQTPEAMKFITKEFAKQAKDADVIVGADARGFLFGTPLSMELNKPFVMVRKPGKLPGKKISQSYDLEYGTSTLEILENSIKKGQKIIVVDDLLATGGTVSAIEQLVKSLGGEVIASLFVIELTFLKNVKPIKNVFSLVKY